LSKIDNLKNISNIIPTENIKNKLDFKIVEALFSILYKKELINKKEYNLLIAQLNHKLQDIPEWW